MLTIAADTGNESSLRACLGCCYTGLEVAQTQAACNNGVPKGD